MEIDGRGLFHNTAPTSAYKYAEHDMQCTHKSDNEPRSRNHCYRGKARSVTNSECSSVALVIQHAKRMRRIILCPVACVLSGCTMFFHVISQTEGFIGNNVTDHKMCFDFLHKFCLKYFSF